MIVSHDQTSRLKQLADQLLGAQIRSAVCDATGNKIRGLRVTVANEEVQLIGVCDCYTLHINALEVTKSIVCGALSIRDEIEVQESGRPSRDDP